MGNLAQQDVQHLSQQLRVSPAACKLLAAQPGQELLVALAVLAPILLHETQIGPGQYSTAGEAHPNPVCTFRGVTIHLL